MLRKSNPLAYEEVDELTLANPTTSPKTKVRRKAADAKSNISPTAQKWGIGDEAPPEAPDVTPPKSGDVAFGIPLATAKGEEFEPNNKPLSITLGAPVAARADGEDKSLKDAAGSPPGAASSESATEH